MCKVLFRIRGNVRWNFAKSSEFTRHIATVVLLEIISIHTISSGCIEINVQSWFLRVTNKGMNASIVKYVDRLFRVVSALGEENFLRYHLKRALIFTVLSSFKAWAWKLTNSIEGFTCLWKRRQRPKKWVSSEISSMFTVACCPFQKVLNVNFLKWLFPCSVKRYLGRIQSYFRCTHNTKWCHRLSIILF